MMEDLEIRRRRDGSIDYDHYDSVARSLRSQGVRKTFRSAAVMPDRLWTKLMKRAFRRDSAAQLRLSLTAAE